MENLGNQNSNSYDGAWASEDFDSFLYDGSPAETEPAPEAPAESEPPAPETASMGERLRETNEGRGERGMEAARESKIKEILSNMKPYQKVLVGGLTAIVGISLIAGAFNLAGKFGKNKNTNTADTTPRTESVSNIPSEAPVDEQVSDYESMEVLNKNDGYFEIGNLVDTKDSDREAKKFSDAEKLVQHVELEAMKKYNDLTSEEREKTDLNDLIKKEAVKITAEQPEAFASYQNDMPDEYRCERYKGIENDSEAEKIADACSDEEFNEDYKEFCDLIDSSTPEATALNGTYFNNFFTIDGDGSLNYDNVNLCFCKTNEKNTPATIFRVGDDELLTIKIGINEDGEWKGCGQSLTTEWGKHTTPEVPPETEVTPTPGIPTPTPNITTTPNPTPNVTPKPTPNVTPKPTPNVTPKPKNAENLQRIDNQALKDIANDINSEKVVVHQEEVHTPAAPSTAPEEYRGTTPDIQEHTDVSVSTDEKQNRAAEEYGENLGGANAGNAEANPVQADVEAQAAANAAAAAATPATAQQAANEFGFN